MLQRCLLMIVMLALAAAGQTTPKSTKTHSAKKTAPAASDTGAATGQHPTAVIQTTAGDLKCELFPDKAPKAVSNFIGLATGTKDWTDPATGQLVHGRPLYTGTIFHRVIPEFMIQGGDPRGNGMGNPGYRFEDELHADLLFDKPGRLAMANSGRNTNGSQFFITEKELPSLNPCFDEGGCMGGQRAKDSGYTIFGQCDDHTVELVKQIARMPRNARDYPRDPVKITRINILNAGKASTPKPSATKSGRTGRKTTKTKQATPNQ